MKVLNLSEARESLTSIVDEVVRTGESVVISRRGEPLVRIVPLEARQGAALPLRGVPIRLAPDFDEPVQGLWAANDE